MTFCEQCGAQLSAGAAFCSSCGKATSLSTTVPSAPLTDTFGAASITAAVAPADDLARLPGKWQRRFAAIEKAGGERVRWWRWPDARKLNWRERRQIYSNFWAFLFGPFYYLFAGMWRKAITLSFVALVIDVILGMAGDALNLPVDNFLWVVSAVMFSQCANVDYYRKTMLKRNGWW
jgi:hypothetical protein